MSHYKSGKVNPVVTACILVLIIIGLLLWLLLGVGCRGENAILDQSVNEEEVIPDVKEVGVGETELGELITPDTIERTHKDPVALMAQLKSSMSNGNQEQLQALLKNSDLKADEVAKLTEFISKNPDSDFVIREVGEVEINKLTRWAVGVEGEDEEFTLDVKRLPSGEWEIIGVNLDGLDNAATAREDDSLTVADSFINAVLNQDFESAITYSESGTISDARIASLCIMFEEGKYALQARKPLRALFTRDTKASYMANVQTSGGEEKGQFSVNLSRDSADSEWKVEEINHDSLLSDYIERVAGGDAYYTPIVQNPEGGDTLALYFDFSEEGLTSRAQRQLQIITRVLKTDPSKKLTLSGHADAVGSNDSNYQLSLKRAESVKQYFISQGISEEQIRILAYGESKPRRQNDTDLGRRANRRTEIYLDF